MGKFTHFQNWDLNYLDDFTILSTYEYIFMSTDFVLFTESLYSFVWVCTSEGGRG